MYTVQYGHINCGCLNQHLMHLFCIPRYILLRVSAHVGAILPDKYLQPADAPKIEKLNIRLPEDGAETRMRM
jgi:hypothetical protein